MPDNRAASESTGQLPKISRRRFVGRVASLALGGTASLSWLAACGEATTPVTGAVSTTPGASLARATSAPTVIPTAVPTATPTLAPTTTPVPATATATFAPTATPVPPKPVNLVIFGDIRTAGPKPPEVYYNLVQQATRYKPDAVLLVGDIINAESDNKATVRTQWANFREATKPLAAAQLLPTIGNHDTNFKDWAEPLYLEAFAPDKIPANGPENYTGHAYSIDLGPVHIASFGSELPAHPHKIGKQQLAWLEKDLSSNTRPYTIVMSHDPAYPLGPHKGSSLDAYPDERDTMWKLLQKYKVAAYICGHEHLYFRSQRNDVTQIIAGTSGSNLYLGYGGGEFQFYTLLTATGNSLTGKVIDSKGKERDSFSL